MTLDELKALFEKHSDEHSRFDRVVNPLHPRPDICAFLMLDRMVPEPGQDMVVNARDEEFYLHVDPAAVAAVITEDEVITLRRCGVTYDNQFDALMMFA
jgi:hypothetical protein